ncbi:MAG: hypothetical protein JSU68_04080 [Phycisphaerales bacterium]|nr:MAG: hypothetical protein JSU68_04080 [Phycisphaerales bacterium]
MKDNPMPALFLAVCVAVSLATFGCRGESDRDAPEAVSESKASDVALPPGLFLERAPQDARELEEVKDNAAVGDRVVLRGRIGGRVEPFVDGRAMFMLADGRMPTCNERHGDGCRTPWDYCCEPKADLLARTATIQLADASGRPLKRTVKGVEGLVPTAEIVVTGKVSQRDDGDVMVVDASGIYVVPE